MHGLITTSPLGKHAATQPETNAVQIRSRRRWHAHTHAHTKHASDAKTRQEVADSCVNLWPTYIYVSAYGVGQCRVSTVKESVAQQCMADLNISI